MSDKQANDNTNENKKDAEQELDIVQGMEEKEPNPDTTGPEENLRQKAAKMTDKSQESKEPALIPSTHGNLS
jgi:hypothetical protein